MAERENLAKAKEVYRLWDKTKGKSVQDWMDIMADEIRFRSLGQGTPGLEFTEERMSRAELGEYFAGLAAEWKMHHYTAQHFIVQGDWVVMLGTTKWQSRATGKVLDTPKADFLEFRDGKVVKFFEFYDTAAAIAANTP